MIRVSSRPMSAGPWKPRHELGYEDRRRGKQKSPAWSGVGARGACSWPYENLPWRRFTQLQ